MRTHTIVALVLGVLGLGGLLYTLVGSHDVRHTIKKHYKYAGKQPVPGGGTAQSDVYVSPQPPFQTAKYIEGKNKPGDRRATPSGIFLRYSSTDVAITPSGTGSKIFVDSARNGYRRNYFYVGGFWGTYSGPGESFRGGGPGGIK